MAIRLLVASFAMLVVTLTPVSARRVVDLESATIADFNAAFKAGTLTSEKLTELFLARIEAYRSSWAFAARAHCGQPQSTRNGAGP